MIQPQELRIGNYFINHKWRWEQVISIEDNNSMSVNGLSKEMINPIPITPEILEQCGFSQFKTSVWRNGRLQWVGSLVYLKNEDTDECYYIPTIVDYLHQLQNLYYSLTNQELTFKTTNNDKSI